MTRFSRQSQRAVAISMLLATLACGERAAVTDDAVWQRAQRHMAKAEQLAASAQYMDAIGEAEKATIAAPDRAATHILHGTLLRRAGEALGAGKDDRAGYYGRAISAFERAIVMVPEEERPRIELALLHDDSDRALQAIALLEPLVVGGSPEVRFHLASILMDQGEHERSRALYAEALLERPDDFAARMSFGIALTQAGDLAGARRELQAAIRLYPGSAAAFLKLGVALDRAGDSDWAIVAMARATELDPRMASAHYQLAMAARRAGRTRLADEAQRRFEEIEDNARRIGALIAEIARADDDVELRAELAEIQERDGRLIAARVTAEGVVAQRPYNKIALLVLARVAEQLGSPLLAQEHVEIVLRSNAADPDALAARGHLHLRAGRGDAAIADLRAALAAGNQDGRTYEELARLALVGDDAEAALEICRAGNRRHPDSTSLPKIAAAGLGRLGRHQEAVRALADYLDLHPADLEAILLLANMARAAGQLPLVERVEERAAFLQSGELTG